MKLAILDLETTGSSPSTDRIIDIGIVFVDDGEVSGRYQQLLNPERPVHPFILSMTRLNRQELEQAPTAAQILPTLFSQLEDRMIVAHNAAFDYGFLGHELLRLGIKLSLPYACSVRVSRRLYPHHQRHSLDAIIERFNLEVESRHRALPDAQAVYDFLEASSRQFSWNDIHRIIHTISKSNRIPKSSNMAPHSANKGPGVYIFYNQSHQPLYIGKSVELPKRISQHFSHNLLDSKDLQLYNQVTEIETIACAGEIEALLLESRLIKQLKPLCNRRLRAVTQLWIATLSQNPLGYHQLDIHDTESLTSHQMTSAVLIAKSKSQLRKTIDSITRDFRLCPVLMGLRTGHCLAADLGVCSGACRGKVSPANYNEQVLSAFAPFQLRSWPLDQRLILSEMHEDRQAHHLVDNWVYQGSFPTLASLYNALKDPDHLGGQFDLDTYRILIKALDHPGVTRTYLPK